MGSETDFRKKSFLSNYKNYHSSFLIARCCSVTNGGIAVYSIKEANFNEKMGQNFHVCLWSGLRGPYRKMSVFYAFPFWKYKFYWQPRMATIWKWYLLKSSRCVCSWHALADGILWFDETRKIIFSQMENCHLLDFYFYDIS